MGVYFGFCTPEDFTLGFKKQVVELEDGKLYHELSFGLLFFEVGTMWEIKDGN